MTSRVSELKKLGQSLWFDQMERSLITTGELRRMIAEGEVLGLTSNPTIFQKAITGSDAYDDTIQRLAREGKSTGEINEALVLEDIAAAADLFLPVFEAAKGGDGFVSIEVSPELAFDAEATTIEARRLHRELHRKMCWSRFPPPSEGLGAIEQLTSEGINVNVTLDLLGRALSRSHGSLHSRSRTSRCRRHANRQCRLGCELFREPHRCLDRKAFAESARRPRACAAARGCPRTLRQGCDCQRQTRLRGLQRNFSRQAIRRIAQAECPCAASVVGLDRHQESEVQRCLLRRYADWSGDRQHRASTDA